MLQSKLCVGYNGNGWSVQAAMVSGGGERQQRLAEQATGIPLNEEGSSVPGEPGRGEWDESRRGLFEFYMLCMLGHRVL